MPNLCDPAYLKELLKRHGFSTAKSLGQNFLIDPSVPARMAGISGACGDCGVIEIGPGVGTMSAELAARAGKLVAVELDRRLEPILAETLAEFDNIEIIFGDVLKTDLKKLAEERLGGLRLFACANLPYYITTKAVMHLLEPGIFEAVTVMVQREAAERFCAQPGDKDYVAATAKARFLAKPEICFDIPPSAFLPNPHVRSSALKFSRREDMPFYDRELVFKIIDAAFSSRRKTMLNTLSAGLTIGRDEVGDILKIAGVEAGVRGETLSVEEFCRIAAAIRQKKQ